MGNKKVSYTQFSLYLQCPKKWKLDYVDGLRTYEHNIYVTFGSAFHKTIQNYLDVVYNKSVKEANSIHLPTYLKEAMFDEYKQSLARNGNVHYSTPQELAEFHADGEAILHYFQKNRTAWFSTKNTTLVGIEIPLQLPITNNVSFTGFIDMVMKNESDGRYKIYDFKTSTAGWNKYQKADQSKTAQLILYKEFYAKQFGVDVDMIDVEYIIVRRKINEELEFRPKRIQTFAPANGKPTRNKINKLFTEFVQNCFTEEGEYNLEGTYHAIQSSACKYCPYASMEHHCTKKDRIKK